MGDLTSSYTEAMAEFVPAEQALEKLNEQLICPICLEHYTDPKLLHCFHAFCEKCLKPLTRQTPQVQVVECPNCCHPTSLTQEGVPGLQGVFFIHHLFDTQDILKKLNATANSKCIKCERRVPNCYCRSCGFLCDSCKKPHFEWKEFSSHNIISLDQLTEDVTNLVPPNQKVTYCTKHPAKELDLYCETCKEVICRDCILKVHRDHQYDLVTDAFPQQKNVLIGSVKPAEQQLASITHALVGLDNLCKEITSQREALETKIRTRIDLIQKVLKVREEELISQLDQMTGQKLKNVASQKDRLEVVATRLKNCCRFLQESMRTGSQVEILAMTKSFVHQAQNMTSSFKLESLAPQEQSNLEFSSNQSEFTQMCQQFGQLIYDSVCHAKCNAEGTGLHVAMVGETATATVHVVDQNGMEYHHPVEVSCKLVSSGPDEFSQVRGEAKKVKDGQYKISYKPQHRGQHYLHIQVEENHISESPFPLSVLTTIPTNIISDVNYPFGLALDSDRQLLVADQNTHSISIFSNNGKKKKLFGSMGSGPDQLDWPSGVAISASRDILVCDELNHRIHIFSHDGKSLKCVGTKGNGYLQFDHPVGISVHPHSNKLYVTDSANHRVQILNEDLTFYKAFGSKGTGNGQLQRPLCVGMDSIGNVYVADADNHRVNVFTANGEYIRQFGERGNGKGELNGPRGIAIDSNDIVYVSEWSNHRISIFTRKGHFLRSFGCQGERPGQFKHPSAITIDSGVIYISDCDNRRVQVF